MRYGKKTKNDLIAPAALPEVAADLRRLRLRREHNNPEASIKS
jgi:hypothetical protein